MQAQRRKVADDGLTSAAVAIIMNQITSYCRWIGQVLLYLGLAEKEGVSDCCTYSRITSESWLVSVLKEQ
jgi:hypothetical protein